MIDKHSPLPLYYQLEEQIKKSIISEELQPGDVLPSERELSENYQISRMTVRQAITNLVNKGYLYREKGKGTFVSSQKFEQNLQGLTSFTEDMKARNLVPGSKLLHFEVSPAIEEIKEWLSLEEEELIYKIKRLRLANDEPIAVETSYLPVKLIPGLTPDILGNSLYKYIEDDLQLSIGHAAQTVEAAIVRDEDIKHLNVNKNVPVLLIQRETYLEDGTPLEIVKSSYRADRYKFKINIERK
ncbi:MULTISPECIES: GntR family transcriptional regulator [Metabacillus]|uniref:GntR family transcriptional regulator n=1 Tax=Metabacillus TaxID=2675233 RepID=UPI001B991ED6|nr:MULTISPECIES: GntR family transcriptional regulator [Metabacillus]MCM3161943.1 GntR family transcriptional regulator [Metabacillus litoralis]UGB31655.1 GntR family transcriptional regulator [Metabacillus sp. B2-18]UHA60342.1 GntR family transcriptional regulator [Metabacillus litoralis]